MSAIAKEMSKHPFVHKKIDEESSQQQNKQQKPEIEKGELKGIAEMDEDARDDDDDDDGIVRSAAMDASKFSIPRVASSNSKLGNPIGSYSYKDDASLGKYRMSIGSEMSDSFSMGSIRDTFDTHSDSSLVSDFYRLCFDHRLLTLTE